MYSYAIFNKIDDMILPDGKSYFSEVKYANCDYIKYFVSNPELWIEDRESEKVFYSNYEKRSFVKSFSNKSVLILSNKQKLAKIIKGEKYSPFTFIFNLVNKKIPDYIFNKWNPIEGSLWFLKKASDLTYGGFDVFPIRVKNKEDALKEISKLIKLSNKEYKYRSDNFVLQKGIDNPLTLNVSGLEYKFDIRAYALLVKINSYTKSENFFFKKFLTRRSISPYDPNSNDKTVMLTNTTLGKVTDVDISNLTNLGTEYSPLFEKMLSIFTDLCKKHFEKLDNLNNTASINIIGLDFIFDRYLNGYLLEINKFPAIHCDKDKREKFHHNLEDFMFNDDFYKITFDSIIKQNSYKCSTENWIHIH